MNNFTEETTESEFEYTESQINQVIVLSALGAISNLYYIFLYYYYNNEARKRVSLEVLFYYFLSNFLTSIGSSVGLPRYSGFACWWEGIMTNIFTLSAVLWIVVLTYILFSIISHRKFKLNKFHHLLCWGIPVLATFLPLINSTYGPPSGEGVAGWCWVVDTEDSPEWAAQVWYWVSYYAWIWISIVCIVILILVMFYQFFNGKSTVSITYTETTKKNFNRSIVNLAFYPLLILICWLPCSIADYIQYSGSDMTIDPNLRASFTSLSSAMGLMSSFVFIGTDTFFIRKIKSLPILSTNSKSKGGRTSEVSQSKTVETL